MSEAKMHTAVRWVSGAIGGAVVGAIAGYAMDGKTGAKYGAAAGALGFLGGEYIGGWASNTSAEMAAKKTTEKK